MKIVALLKLKFGWGAIVLHFCPRFILLGASWQEDDDGFYLFLYFAAFQLLIKFKHPPLTMLPQGGAA